MISRMNISAALRKGMGLALRLTNRKEGRLAARWHLETPPIHYRYLRTISLLRPIHDLLQRLSAKTLSNRMSGSYYVLHWAPLHPLLRHRHSFCIIPFFGSVDRPRLYHLNKRETSILPTRWGFYLVSKLVITVRTYR